MGDAYDDMEAGRVPTYRERYEAARAEVERLTAENLRLARIIDPAYGLADPVSRTTEGGGA